MLFPNMSVPLGLPCRVNDLADDPGIRKRMESITARHTEAITASFEELGSLGLVEDVSTQIRLSGGSRLFKLYIINNTDTFFGFYPVVRHTITVDGKPLH